MYTSLKPTDPGAFQDWVKKEPMHGFVDECPKCRGFGGWNLQVNAYGAGKHFQCTCSVCYGWGYVKPSMLCTNGGEHDWQYVKHLGNCWRQYKCHCGAFTEVDSSD